MLVDPVLQICVKRVTFVQYISKVGLVCPSAFILVLDRHRSHACCRVDHTCFWDTNADQLIFLLR
jgi:hypothetical protein